MSGPLHFDIYLSNNKPFTFNTGKARFNGQFRGKSLYRGQMPPDDATVFTVRGKLHLEDNYFKKL